MMRLEKDLAEYSSKRTKQFSWEKTARLAWNAIGFSNNERQNIDKRVYSVSPGKHKQRIAYVSPLPPEKSGIAEYSTSLLPYLVKYFDIDLYTTGRR